MEPKMNGKFFAGLVVVALFVIFLWSVQHILSPFLIAGVLLFILFGLRESLLAREVSVVIILVLIIWVFSKAQSVFFPLITSFIIAYLFNPIVVILEEKRVSRTLAVLLILLIAFGLVITFGIIIIPSLINEIQELIKAIPGLAKDLAAFTSDLLVKVQQTFDVQDLGLEESWVDKIPSRLEQVFSNLLKSVMGVGTFLGQILNIILIPLTTFYILKDYNIINKWIMSLVPRKYRSITSFYLWRLNRILGGYLRGQIIVCSLVGFLSGVGLAVLHVPFAVLLGVIIAVLNIIPFVGFFISLSMCFLLSLMSGSGSPFIMFVKILVVFLIVRVLETYVIAPKIVGDRVGLHPIVVISAALVFSVFFGIWGLVIGVPTAALIKFLIDEWLRRQKRRELLEEKSIP